MDVEAATGLFTSVALRKESVDRNLLAAGSLITLGGVALRKESVDRNCGISAGRESDTVALRKESVDRNLIDEIQLEFNSRRSPQGERG